MKNTLFATSTYAPPIERRTIFALLPALFLAVSLVAAAQSPPDDAVANPGRPTVSTPATLTPVGYLQFETGYLYANQSPQFSSQSSFNEVLKFSPLRRMELLVSAEPFAYSHAEGQPSSAAGGVSLQVQGVVYAGEGSHPTIALSYFRQVYGGNAPDLDIGSATNSAIVLISGDVKGFHYDINYMFNEQVENGVRRAQFGQTLSVSHPLGKNFGLSGEIWHFTAFSARQFSGQSGALNYTCVRTSSSIAGSIAHNEHIHPWEGFLGFTYLLPHRVSAP